ncbi:unnamed protein product [Adineta ricciae]|uniref:EF-hand domain-containing protein n=1 Tax=Adineta ricciae TaxID=249248 RepID=A0A815WAY9_ADIRI|nr:unnamed protein product [Adineta ricciae]
MRPESFKRFGECCVYRVTSPMESPYYFLERGKIDVSGDKCISYDEIKKFMDKITKLDATARGEDVSEVDLKKITSDIFSEYGVNEYEKLSKEQFIEG